MGRETAEFARLLGQLGGQVEGVVRSIQDCKNGLELGVAEQKDLRERLTKVGTNFKAYVRERSEDEKKAHQEHEAEYRRFSLWAGVGIAAVTVVVTVVLKVLFG